MRKVLLVVLILLVGGLIAADRIGVRMAQDEIAKRVASEYKLPERPEVTIHGFPFLTQAVAGKYQRIDVKIASWTQQNVTVKDVDVELADVRAPLSDVLNGNSSQVTANTATASVVIPYDVVRKNAPEGVKRLAANGPNLEITGVVSGLGLSTDVTAVVSVRATRQGIAITPVSGRAGNGPQIPLTLLRQHFTYVVPVRDLPLGSRISKVKIQPDGLALSATADDVKLSTVSAAP